MTRYDSDFFEYVNIGSIRSARLLLPKLLAVVDAKTVLDVGCGAAAWLSVWQELGVEDVIGIDGDYVDRDSLPISKERFVEWDLSHPFNIERRFDLVQCLEVAEHLPEASAQGLVDSLTAHSDLVLFSAAPKGQGGDGHINEQNYDYWRARFSRCDFVPVDYLRPRVKDYPDVEPWYRYNSLLYAKREILPILPEAVRESVIADDVPIPDVSPPSYKVRKMIIRLLPLAVKNRLAKLKERMVVMRNADSPQETN